MSTLPSTFTRTITRLCGEAGRAWLRDLPALLAACERRWSLTLGPPFPDLSHNYVAPAIRADGTAVVVKACLPGGEFVAEGAALGLYAGRGAVRLLDADPVREVLLLERVQPGMLLSAVPDDERATTIAATVMRQLWRPAPPDGPFPHVADWAAGLRGLREVFDGGTGPLPSALVAEAERLFAEFGASAAAPVVLHGDLHHFNILAAGDGRWVAIDPKGLIGEPAYEPGALLRNPWPGLLDAPHPGRILARRVDQLAEELGFDRVRIRGWALAQAVLAACWSLEGDGDGWRFPLACAELLAAIEG